MNLAEIKAAAEAATPDHRRYLLELPAREVAAELQEWAGFMVQAYRGYSAIVDMDKLQALLVERDALPWLVERCEALEALLRAHAGMCNGTSEVRAGLRAALARLEGDQ